MKFQVTMTFETHNPETANQVCKDMQCLAEHYVKQVGLMELESFHLKQIEQPVETPTETT